MKLKQIMAEPMKTLLYMERYVNDGSPSGFTWINQTSCATSPLSEQEFFFLDILYGEDGVETIGEFPFFLNKFGKKMIFIHPDMSEQYYKKGIRIEKSTLKVVPTASSRTVKLLDFPGYIKLNYNGIIGRIDRKLTDVHAKASVEITAYLKEALRKPIYSRLAFFPESGAVIYRDEKKAVNMGVVYREDVPYGQNNKGIKCMIPMFSVFSCDRYTSDECILVQLIKKSQREPQEYVLNELIFVIIDNYFKLLLNEGIQPEWHSQNLLLGVGEDYSVVSLIMRDLESIDIDENLQKKVGIKKKFESYPYKYLNSSQYNYQIKHSFMYDFKIGEYVFKPIIECVCRYFGLNKEIFEKIIKEYSRQYIEQLPEDFFPLDHNWYSFEHVLVDRTVEHRPYVKNEGVKYRK